ncbi:MAG: arginase [Paracoccaceae bacterium]
MTKPSIALIGAPIDCGKRRNGCLMGPDSLRTAGLAESITALGYTVQDLGDLNPGPLDLKDEDHLHAKSAVIAWQKTLSAAMKDRLQSDLPIFMGGDHAMALGTLHGAAEHAATVGRPLYVLWLDAHTDYHTLDTTQSGNLHGTPMGYVTERAGFAGFPAVPHPIPLEQVCMIGLRSVDAAEKAALQESNFHNVDMRAIDEGGIVRPLHAFLDQVARANGLLHVSFDVDFLDPEVAPAVGTTVPGGATLREAHLVMEMLSDSNLMSSMDIAELNPFLDERGRTASTIVDLVSSAFGKRIFDRPTHGGA